MKLTGIKMQTFMFLWLVLTIGFQESLCFLEIMVSFDLTYLLIDYFVIRYQKKSDFITT